MRRLILLGFPLLLAGCNYVDASAPNAFHFVDLRKPHGHSRGVAGEIADGRICDARVGAQTSYVSARYKACMRGLGWKYAYARPAPADESSGDTVQIDTASVSAPDPGPDYAAQAQEAVNEENAVNSQLANDAATAASQAQLAAGIAASFQ